MGQLNGRVLLVDDDPLIRKLISRYLVAAGYCVETAVDGVDGLEKLVAEPPDLIISDINMPRMSGLELLKVIRNRFPELPIVIISADPSNIMPEGLAADAFFYKYDFGFERLLHAVSNLVRKPDLRTALSQVDNKPVQAKWDGDRYHMIGCGDFSCVFSVPGAVYMPPSEKRTVCVQCGKVVQFLVTDGDPQGPV